MIQAAALNGSSTLTAKMENELEGIGSGLARIRSRLGMPVAPASSTALRQRAQIHDRLGLGVTTPPPHSSRATKSFWNARHDAVLAENLALKVELASPPAAGKEQEQTSTTAETIRTLVQQLRRKDVALANARRVAGTQTSRINELELDLATVQYQHRNLQASSLALHSTARDNVKAKATKTPANTSASSSAAASSPEDFEAVQIESQKQQQQEQQRAFEEAVHAQVGVEIARLAEEHARHDAVERLSLAMEKEREARLLAEERAQLSSNVACMLRRLVTLAVESRGVAGAEQWATLLAAAAAGSGNDALDGAVAKAREAQWIAAMDTLAAPNGRALCDLERAAGCLLQLASFAA
jgi:hypothetical protein